MWRYVVAFGIGAAWLLLGVVAVIYVGGAIVTAIARGIALLPRAIVWLFVAMQEGADWWSIAARAGAVIAETLATSQIAFSLIGLELVGAAALYGLQRLLKDEGHPTAQTGVEAPWGPRQGRGAGSEEVRK
jgi:hypothetical protein